MLDEVALSRGVIQYCCGATWGSGYYWCFLQWHYMILLSHPNLWFTYVILAPMLLPTLNSVKNQGSYGPLKTQYLEAGALEGNAWN